MDMREELILLLPTPSARWSALLTSVLLTPAFLAPSFLKPFLWPTATDKELALLQILTTTLVLLIGSLLILVSVVRAHNEQAKQHTLELQKQRQHFESLASAEKERNSNFNKKLEYPNLGGEGSWMG